MRFTVALALLVVAGCQHGKQEASTADAEARVSYSEDGMPEGLPRFHKWTDRHLQGAQPEGDVAFRNLAALGVTTVISVDGSIPDLEAAHKYGLTYAHVPFGYDGVPREQALRIIRAAQSSKGNVYVHCHHGKHRGPAGMMAVRIAIDNISNEEAIAELKASGTSDKYEGLYADTAKFVAPTEAEMIKVPAVVPEKVVPQGLQASMVGISHRFEQLKKSRAGGWSLVADCPDMSPPHEARMIWELFRESARAGDGKEHGDEYAGYLAEGERSAVALEKALRANDHAAADQQYKALSQNCKSCHSQFRD
jgi:protein tyrosine phosphatase (PTP) superfamily phosphohydrolase (DUF442 family)